MTEEDKILIQKLKEDNLNSVGLVYLVKKPNYTLIVKKTEDWRSLLKEQEEN